MFSMVFIQSMPRAEKMVATQLSMNGWTLWFHRYRQRRSHRRWSSRSRAPLDPAPGEERRIRLAVVVASRHRIHGWCPAEFAGGENQGVVQQRLSGSASRQRGKVLDEAGEPSVEPFAVHIVIDPPGTIEDIAMLIPAAAVIDIDETCSGVGLRSCGQDQAQAIFVLAVAVLFLGVTLNRPDHAIAGDPVRVGIEGFVVLGLFSQSGSVGTGNFLESLEQLPATLQRFIGSCRLPPNESRTVVGSRSNPMARVGRKPQPMAPLH